MKVARYYTEDDVRLEEMPVPSIGPGELLVRVAACGVCGSDVMGWYTQKKAPAVLGHEPAGVVVAVGQGVTQFRQGDRVFMHHHVPCFVCHYCRRGFYSNCRTFRETHLDPGGFAEYVRVPAPNVERDVLKLPDSMPWDVATFIEPVGTIIRGVERAHLRHGDSVAIVGAGLTGLLFIQLARLWGGSSITALDLQDWRLDYARRMGAERVVNPTRENAVAAVQSMTEGRGADVVFTTGGLGPTVDDLTLPAIAQALSRPMELEDRALELVQATYRRLAEAGYVDDEALTEERRKMAVLPAGAAPLFNPVGAAPGVVLRESGATIICLPGVPAELKGIFEESLGPLLRELYGDGYYAERVIQVDCGDESALAPLVNAVAARHADVYVKSRAKAYGPNVRLKITLSARGESRRSVTALLDAASEDLLRRLDKRGIRVIEQEP